MTVPIRPGFPQIPPSRPQGAPDDAARAAQRAFFSQAMNAAQADEAIAPAAAVAPVQRRAAAERIDIPAEQPERGVRPGSYLDIRV